MNGGGRYAKNSMRIFFFFFWLILGYSLVITACGGAKEEPPDDTMQSMSPQQIMITSTTPGTDSIAVTWALDTNSTGENVVGVVAVLQEAALTPANACENVPANVAAHARDGSGEASGTSGSTTYMASNSTSGTLTFGSLAASTMYSIAVCSVSVMKIRGDGTGGTAHSAVVTSVTTNSTTPPPPGSPPQQIMITSTTPGTDSIAVTWALEAGSTGENVVGVVAVLQEAALTPESACENVPANVTAHARGGSGEASGRSGSTTYMASNSDSGTLTISNSGSLAASTMYSIAVCSVSVMKIRGDGTGGTAHSAVVTSVTTNSTTPPPPGSPPQQIMITSTTPDTDSIAVTWALDANSTGENVVGVVAVLQEAALTDVSACENVPANVAAHARDGSGEASGRSGSTTYMASNSTSGTLTFDGLAARTMYSIAVCSVSAMKIRGDGNADRDDGHAVVRSVTTNSTTPPPPGSPPQQIMITSTTPDTDSIAVTWALDANSTGENVVGVVAVLQEAALTDVSACENVPANVAAHARDGSGEASGRSGSAMYMASNSNSGTLTFGSLAASTMYSIAVCSVSAMKIRGDGNADRDDGHAVVRSVMTEDLLTFPKQVMVPRPTFTPGSPPTITVRWSANTSSSGAPVIGVVAALKVQTGSEASLSETDACDLTPVLTNLLLTRARGTSSQNLDSLENSGVTYIADNRDGASEVMFSFSISGLTGNALYSIAVCSVSAEYIRGDGNSDGDNAHAVVYGGIGVTRELPVKQIEVTTTNTANTITVNWAVSAAAVDSHQDVQGVVAALREVGGTTVALNPSTACSLTDGDGGATAVSRVTGYARTGTGTASSSGGELGAMVMAQNNADDDGDSDPDNMGSLTFTGLRPTTTYSIVVCAVSMFNIRGDGNDVLMDDDAVLVDPSVTTSMLRFPKQVTVPMPVFTIGSSLINVRWSANTGSSGEDVQGVVAALKAQTGSEASLNQTNACENVPMAISDHARGASTSNPSRPMTSGGVTYIADNRDGASEVMLSFSGPTDTTTYSLAVCSVSAGSIRGDGNSDGDNAHAVVYSGISATPQLPVKQIEVTITNTTNTITLNWAVSSSADDTHQDVVGVIALLRRDNDSDPQLDPGIDCKATDAVRRIIGHARTGSGTASTNRLYPAPTTTFAANHDSDNDGEGSLTFTRLRTDAKYFIVVCSVSANNIRGDDNDILMDDDAIFLADSNSRPVRTGARRPKQIQFAPMSPAVRTSTTITVGWSVDTTDAFSGEAVTGVVAVASTSALNPVTACANAPASIFTHARSVSNTGTNPIRSNGHRYAAQENTDGDDSDTNPDNMGILTITGLTPKTSYYIAACSVSTGNIRGGDNGTVNQAIAITSALETPGVVVLYKSESVLNDADDHARSGGDFSALAGNGDVGVDVCGVTDTTPNTAMSQTLGNWGASPAVAGSDYAGHTFYGSRNDITDDRGTADTADDVTVGGDFNNLPARLGVTDPGKREVWVYHVAKGSTASHTWTAADTGAGETMPTVVNTGAFHKPSTLTTLSELIALDSDGDYTNQGKVKPVFQLLQNGSETANSNFEHWSFTNVDGTFSGDTADCANGTDDPGTNATGKATFGRHHEDDNGYIGGSATTGNRNDNCTASDKTVLCIARQDSGF